MQVSVQVTDKVNLVAQGETQLEVFTALAEMQEVFGDSACGKCKGTALSFRVRKVVDGKKEYTYPELHCQNYKCRARLTYGQMEGGKLFPVRFERKDGEYVKDDNGKSIPKGSYGWTIYNKETGKDE